MRARAGSSDVSGWTDCHCHCLPGIDDGPRNWSESLTLCRRLRSDGVARVVATPHHGGRGWAGPEPVRRGVAELRRRLRRERIALDVRAGAEIHIDERVLAWWDAGEILSLADGGRFLLLEWPPEVWLDLSCWWDPLRRRGLQVVWAHPERHWGLQRRPDRIRPWLGSGLWVQITAPALLGRRGPVECRAAWELLRLFPRAVVASDAHDTQERAPCMSQAYRLLEKRLGWRRARQLCQWGPEMLVCDRDGQTGRKADLMTAGQPS